MSSAVATSAKPQDALPVKKLSDYQPPNYFIKKISLLFRLAADATEVISELTVVRRLEDSQSPLHLDGVELTLKSIKMDGAVLQADEYQVTPEELIIYTPPEHFTLQITTVIKPVENTSLEGLYESKGMLCTQCEAEGFRKITYNVDRPDNMAIYETRIEANKSQYPILLSNGNLIDSGELDDGYHFATWHDPHPKPCYLFALVAGDLAVQEDSFTTVSGRQVKLAFYVEPQDLNKVDFAIDALKNSMAWDEKRYGREYDLDIFMVVAVSHFNMGAMENKGLNIFNTKCVLASPNTSTDSQYAGVEGVIAHEYFHNWSGNRITCRDWFQLSLKEGFTVFRDQQFSMEVDSWLAHRIGAVKMIRNVQFPQDAGPMAHPIRPAEYIEINNFYTVTVYDKGAEVIRMLNTILGDELFFKGTQRYFERFDGQAVTTEDFLSSVTEDSGFNTQVFERWYHQAGTPEIKIHTDWTESKNTLEISFAQRYPRFAKNQPVSIPVRFGLISKATGKPVEIQGEHAQLKKDTHNLEAVFILESQQDTLTLEVTESVVPSFMRGFSAPVTLQSNISDDHLLLLMAKDVDPFNRWESAQLLMSKALLSGQAQNNKVAKSLIDAWQAVFENTAISEEERALVCSLPHYSALAEMQANNNQSIAVNDILDGRQSLRLHIATTCFDSIQTMYSFCDSELKTRPYSPNTNDKGLRALKNLALSFLAVYPTDEIQQLVYDQFVAADNITDRLSALQLLVHDDLPQAQAALAMFERDWAQDQLAMDQWFAIQASNPNESVLETIAQLKAHRLYDPKSPNNVRSIMGAFAGSNPRRFHALDGSGYQLLTDCLVEYNKANPQLAARMATPLTQWARYDEQRQKLIQQQLHELAQLELSPDLYEIVERSLKKASA